ncbi:hypothetical protein V2J09_022136 [Rumex salicifolius]
MGLKDIGETLPPGFRFYPSDEELVCHYLHKKIANEEALKGSLVEIDLHTCEPWQLPGSYYKFSIIAGYFYVWNIFSYYTYTLLLDCLVYYFFFVQCAEVAKLSGSEWYFFSFRDRKYATGFRTNRATASGYWKATGKDRVILDPNTRQAVGMRKTLVFYRNRAPNGLKSGWIMHEFRMEAPHAPPKEDWVLCRVFHKSKEESHNNPHLFDTTSTTTSPPLPSHVQANTMVYGYQGSDGFDLNPNPESQTYIQTCNDPNPAYHSTLVSNNHLMYFLKEEVNPYTSNCSFNEVIMMDDHHGADDYGLLWDMGLQGIDNAHHLSHSHNFGDHIYGVN